MNRTRLALAGFLYIGQPIREAIGFYAFSGLRVTLELEGVLSITFEEPVLFVPAANDNVYPNTEFKQENFIKPIRTVAPFLRLV